MTDRADRGTCVTYHRTSTADQDPTLARDRLRQAAGARGLEVVEEIEETGSGARNDRPGLQRVLELARDGCVNAVLVWKIDRFGRSALDLLANIEALVGCGVRFIATTQGLDIKPDADPMSRLLLTMLAAVAEFERELIRERTRLGLARARKRGVRLGRQPRLSELDKARVAQLRAEGLSWSKVAKRLEVSVSTAKRAARQVTNGGLPDVPQTA
jgi:putative DNA-invertase from lambdoid prophage Rac